MPVDEASLEETLRPLRHVGRLVRRQPCRCARGAQRGEGRRDVSTRGAGAPVPRRRRTSLRPPAGRSECALHAEGVQEGFLVLSGECTLLVEEEECPLRQWDYFHCPAETRHVIVGAGEGPCAILMLGARPEVETLLYPVSEIAAKYGASVAKETVKPDEAYADWPGEFQPVRLPWQPGS